MAEDSLIQLLLSKVPELDLSWPQDKITSWVNVLATILRACKDGQVKNDVSQAARRERRSPGPQRQKPGPRFEAAKDPTPASADEPARTKGRPAGAEMCPGCKKMIKPVDLTVKVNDRRWHAECAPEE